MDKYEVWIGNDKGHPFVGIEADGKERRKYAHFWNELPQDWLLGVMMDGHGRRVREVPADVLVAVEWDTETTSPSSLVAEGAGPGNSAPEADPAEYAHPSDYAHWSLREGWWKRRQYTVYWTGDLSDPTGG